MIVFFFQVLHLIFRIMSKDSSRFFALFFILVDFCLYYAQVEKGEHQKRIFSNIPQDVIIKFTYRIILLSNFFFTAIIVKKKSKQDYLKNEFYNGLIIEQFFFCVNLNFYSVFKRVIFYETLISIIYLGLLYFCSHYVLNV